MAGNLKEKLQEKLDGEYRQFTNELQLLSKEQIISNSYEITCKNEIKDYLSYHDLDENAIKALLKSPNLLAEMYDEWMSADSNLYEPIIDSIDNCIEDLKKNYEMEKSKKGRER